MTYDHHGTWPVFADLPISGMPTRSTKHAAISAWRTAQYQKADQAMKRASESMERAVCTQPMLIATYFRWTPWTAPMVERRVP
tara:strand:+ start:700 stop:948 length:249 start_codon:yes stop_codon:yes gene_type:complete